MSQDKILVGDCLDRLAELPAESFDALVTDPPYGIGETYGGTSRPIRRADEHWEWLRPRYELALSRVRPGGFIAVWQSSRYLRHLWDWFGGQIRIFSGCKNFVRVNAAFPHNGWDPVVLFYKRGAPRPQPQDLEGVRYLDWHVANTTGSLRDKIHGVHPHPKPLDTVEYLLRAFTVPGAHVLDPFLGAGTTLVACRRTGRTCVGIELSEEYAETSRKRAAGSPRWTQPPLFDPAQEIAVW